MCLGGNSLVAVRLMAKIQREFQQELPIAVLFQKATPEQLAIELLRRPSHLRATFPLERDLGVADQAA